MPLKGRKGRTSPRALAYLDAIQGLKSEGSNATSYPDQLAFNYTASQAASSYAGSMSTTQINQLGPGENELSIASFRTSYTAYQGEDRAVRTQGGRDFNLLSDTYSLPTDVTEWDRLDKQHRALVLAMDGLYPEPEVVRAVLAPEYGVTKRIVDLGCGTGIWSTEMAREFPHCEVLGVDLAPVPLPEDGHPSNCRFEMDDISRGLSHLHGRFDVVFARLIALGLKDFRKSLSDATACLKPGGILIWIDADLCLYSGWPMVYRPFWSSENPEGSYAARVAYEIRRTSTSLLSSDVSTMEKVLDEGLWTNAPALDPDTCKTASLCLPIGPWCEFGVDLREKERLKYVGMLMRQDLTEGSRSAAPLILKAGWSKETVDRWTEGMRDECRNGTLVTHCRLGWGRRRETSNSPAPALVIAKVNTGESRATRYPLYEVYDTQDQSLAAAAIRNRGNNIPAPPAASQSRK